MNVQKAVGEIREYVRQAFVRCDAEAAADFLLAAKGPRWNIQDRSQHVLFMCDEVERFVREGEREKAMRWLGFLQGVAWAEGWFTVDQMREHNR